MMAEILQTVHGVSKLLQSAQCDLIKALVLLKASFKKYRASETSSKTSTTLLQTLQRPGVLKNSLKTDVSPKRSDLLTNCVKMRD